MPKRLLLLLGLIFFWHTASAQSLTSMTPNSGTIGQNQLTTTITGSNIYHVAISLWGNVETIELRKGATVITLFDYMNGFFNAYVTSDYSVDVTWDIPPNVSAGVYDLYVKTLDTTSPTIHYYDTLHNAFTIIPSDGIISGSVFYDNNLNGIRDTGEHGLQNELVQLLGPYTYTINTDTSGAFSFGVANGSYTLSIPSTWPMRHYTTFNSVSLTVSNNVISGLYIGVVDPLYGMTPSKGFEGQVNVNAIVNAYDAIFTTGTQQWGNISSGYLSPIGGGANIYFANTAFRVLTSNQVQLVFDIPSNQLLGDYRLFIRIGNSLYAHDSVFTILDAPSRISGIIYFDSNENGVLDAGEPPVSWERVNATPDAAYAFSDSNGIYTLELAMGLHYLSWQPTNGWYYLRSNPATYWFINSGNLNGFHFGLRSSAADYTTGIIFTPGACQCSSTVTNTFSLVNQSNVVTQGGVRVVKSPAQTFAGAFSPGTAVINGDTLTWLFSSLQPMNRKVFSYQVLQPPSGLVNSTVLLDVTDGGGTTMFSTSTSHSRNISCSGDSLKKEVTPEGIDPFEHFTLFQDTLDYLIRFQNALPVTVNDVIIRDTMDDDLDINTLELVASSHSVDIDVDSNRAVVFTFNNILLPSSNVDEPGSRGFIRYRIRCENGLPEQTRVENKAYVYLDVLPRAETNTVWNSMVSVINTGMEVPQLMQDEALFYPNPMQHTAWILFRNEAAEEAVLSVFNLNGQLLEKIRTNSDRFEIKREGKSPGLYQYFIDCQTSGKRLQGRIIVE